MFNIETKAIATLVKKKQSFQVMFLSVHKL